MNTLVGYAIGPKKIKYSREGFQMQNNNELYHYGRLGMKWGRRIYSDKYGGLKNAGHVKVNQLASEYDKLSGISTLTKKGEKRKSDIEKQYTHLTGKPISSHVLTKKTNETPSQKRIHDMTNEELSAYNTRKQLETTYLNYQPKPQISKGKQFTSVVLNKVITPVAVKAGQAYLTKVIENAQSSAAAAKAATKTAAKVVK